jgi:hypothetical protein
LGEEEETFENTHFAMCPSRSKTVFICERRSGSCVVVVYVETALGSLTGVVDSDAIVLAFPCSEVFELLDGGVN